MAQEKQRTARSAARPPRAGAEAGGVRLERAYDEHRAAGGARVLVDRLWPRGVRKEALALDAWMKEIAPSDELRRWFGHDPARWDEFAARYRDELRQEPAAGLVGELVARAKRGPLTLVYGAKDELHNQAVVLRDLIEQRVRRARRAAPRAPSRGVAARPRAPAGGPAKPRRAGSAGRAR